MQIDRRDILKGAGALAAVAGAVATLPAFARSTPFAPFTGPRSRVLYVNDLAGDIDGLFATVHLALSATSQLRGIVGSAAMFPSENSQAAAALGSQIVATMGLASKVPVHVGAASRFAKGAQDCPGVRAIVAEALRKDTDLPLYIAVGGGLTEVASAVKLEPRVAQRATLVWIGGGAWPAGGKNEYNFGLDSDAARYLFNETAMPIWTIPQEVYATCVISATELQAYVAPHGRIGAWLYRKLVDYPRDFAGTLAKIMPLKLNAGETWTLGDSPLAVLTSLGDWVPGFADGKLSYTRTGSSHYDEVICPTLNPDGSFTPRTAGRKIRIYKDIDTRLMFGDFFAKLAVNFPAR